MLPPLKRQELVFTKLLSTVAEIAVGHMILSADDVRRVRLVTLLKVNV